MPAAPRLPLLAIGLALGTAVSVGACTSGAPPPPTAAPSSAAPPTGSPAVSPSPDTARVDHPTGATDVVLRYEEGGGFAPVEWSLSSAPIFTLYGDGTVVFRDPSTQLPPDESGLIRYPAFRTARLSPDQIESLLEFAVTEGGLAAARDRYDNPMLADAGNAVFTINAGGRTKQVTVTGLFESDASAPDAVSRSQFVELAERLRSFDQSGDVATSEYSPEQWRVHLIEAAGVEPPAVHPWPWADLTPDDFTADGNFPFRVMSADEVGQLGVDDPAGGLAGYYVKAPDGTLYSLAVRPLLPGEAD